LIAKLTLPTIDVGSVRFSMFNKERALSIGGEVKRFFAPCSAARQPGLDVIEDGILFLEDAVCT
jgi:hypothetical protein